MFIIKDNGEGWKVSGPYTLISQKDGVGILNTGESIPTRNCYNTMGGATKACLRRNYDSKGETHGSPGHGKR